MQKNRIVDPDKLFFKSPLKGSDAYNFSFDLIKIKTCLNALASNDTSCVIYGDRGVGKTSFAWQIVSILNGTNKKYSKKELLVVGTEKNFKTVFFKGSAQINDIYEMLLNILRPSSDPFSLCKLFPELYEDEDYKKKFTSKFKFDLFTLLNVQISREDETKASPPNNLETYQILTSANKIQNLFTDVIAEIKQRFNVDLIIFIDEIDQIQNKSGLGSFIKNVGEVKFAFVGIADTISQIITDHNSAGRKLIGGGIEIEKLQNSQIRWIFENAQLRSNEGINIQKSFIDLAIKYSNGYPWIAQNLGYHALLAKRLHGTQNDETIQISGKDFSAAIGVVMENYKLEAQKTINFEVAVSGPVPNRILLHIWNSNLPISDEELRHLMGKDGRLVPHALNRLQVSGILVKTGLGKYRFNDPSIRILTKFILDSSGKNQK